MNCAPGCSRCFSPLKWFNLVVIAMKLPHDLMLWYECLRFFCDDFVMTLRRQHMDFEMKHPPSGHHRVLAHHVAGWDFFSDGWPYYLPKAGEWRCGDSFVESIPWDVFWKSMREMQVSCRRSFWKETDARDKGPGKVFLREKSKLKSGSMLRCLFHKEATFLKHHSTEVDVARAWATLVFVDSHGNSMEVPNCQQLKDIGFCRTLLFMTISDTIFSK